MRSSGGPPLSPGNFVIASPSQVLVVMVLNLPGPSVQRHYLPATPADARYLLHTYPLLYCPRRSLFVPLVIVEKATALYDT